MKRGLLATGLLLVFSAPAFSIVDFNVVQADPNLKIVSIIYSGELVSAIALDITVDSNTIIAGISNYKTGESTAGVPGYGIFPGRFRDYIDAANPNWADPNYTPVAPAGDPDAHGGIGTNGVTIELGSLYVGEPNKPATSGTLCKLLLSTTSMDYNLTISANAARGGVVKEDGNEATTNLPIVKKPGCFPLLMAPQLLYGPYDFDCNVPVYWGPSIGAASYDLERSLNGGAYMNVYSGASTYKMDNTNSVTGMYRYRVKANNACGSSAWTTGIYDVNVMLLTCYKTPADPNYASWISLGRPMCWCGQFAPPFCNCPCQCEGDIDCKKYITYQIYSGDLGILAQCWKKTATQIAADPNFFFTTPCPVNCACADVDHKAYLTYRVYSNDLSIIFKNWKKPVSQLPCNCPR